MRQWLVNSPVVVVVGIFIVIIASISSLITDLDTLRGYYYSSIGKQSAMIDNLSRLSLGVQIAQFADVLKVDPRTKIRKGSYYEYIFELDDLLVQARPRISLG